MNFLSKIFKKKDEPIKSYEDFWNWFKHNEKTFHKVVKEEGDIDKYFFAELSPKLNQLKDGFFFLTGMLNDDRVELVFTVDGEVKNIVFVEELVDSAPKIDGWVFTKLKPALGIESVNISMAGYEFNKGNIRFHSNDSVNIPDEIDITIVHNDLNEDNKKDVTTGTFIFLDNLLGELNFATKVDNVEIIGKNETTKELVPIEKLNDFLIWREKEFIEKYKGVRYNTEDDGYLTLEAELTTGNILLAVINADLLEWDSKASHPWILTVIIKYGGIENNGMPDDETYMLLDKIEQDIIAELKDYDGYLNIGRQTADGVREIYFACKDFRKPSKVLYNIEQQYANRIGLSFDIYKDKYWQTFDRFITDK